MLVNKILDEDEESEERSLEACSESCQESNSGKVNYTKETIFYSYIITI